MTPPQYPAPSFPGVGGPQPGWYPLRPLRIGELLAAGLRIATRHLAVLAPLAFVAALAGSAANLGVLAVEGSLRSYASGDNTRLPPNATTAQAQAVLHYLAFDVFPGLAALLLVSVISTPIVAAVATPFAALGATSRTVTNAGGIARLAGRVPVLLGVGVVVGLATIIGSVLLVVPGVIVGLMLLPAGPVAAMEGLGVRESLRRAMTLSKGFKGRLLGVTLLIGLIAGVLSLVGASIVGRLVTAADPVTHLVLTQLLATVISAVVAPWSSAVTAMLYVDLRMRREGLAQALLTHTR